MRAKLTYEYVKEQFENEEYILVSTRYINAHIKLVYICPKGHEGSMSWNQWQRGTRCRLCSIERVSENNRMDMEVVKAAFEKEGYTLLTKEYTNAHTKLEFVCPRGHHHSITWGQFNSGKRCGICYKENLKDIAKLRRHTTEFIKGEFEKDGYILLTKEYKNAFQKLEYVCPKGHRGFVTWNNWQHGNRCYECSGSKPYTIDYIKKEFEKEGYKLLTSEYNNNKSKLNYVCPKGHKGNMSFSNWLRGCRCRKCYYEGKRNTYTADELKKYRLYRKLVVSLTNANFRKYYYKINPLRLPRGNEYHLDHIYSVNDGFKNDVEPEIIASWQNLQMLTAEENISKHDTSHMTLARLYQIAIVD